MDAPRHFHRDSIEFARAFTFFDAVYAFALTLLVVNVEPPDAAHWSSLDALLDAGLGAHLLGFAVSFIVIAAFWRMNHRLVSGFEGATPRVIVANLVVMFFIVLIPFSTQGVSDSATSGFPLAIALYAVNISLAVLSQSAMYYVAEADGILTDPLPPRARRIMLADSLVTPVVFLLSIPIAYLVGPDAARWSWLSLAVLGPLSGILSGRAIARIRADAGGSAVGPR